MKKIITISVLTILALALAACGASSGSTQSNLSSGSSPANSGSSGSSNPAPASGTGQPTGPSGLQLAAGILKLDGTSNAVTAQQAAQLLPSLAIAGTNDEHTRGSKYSRWYNDTPSPL